MTHSVTLNEKRQAVTAIDSALDSARHYANASRADSTWRAYETDIAIFQRWCSSVQRAYLPASTETVAAFLAIEADSGKAVSTLRRRLAAIRLLHVANDVPSPHESIRVTDVLKGIARKRRDRSARKAKPALDSDIMNWVDAMDTTTLAGKRDRALILVGFDAALRRSELVSIRAEQIEHRPEGLILTLPYSKTDQLGDGDHVGLLRREESSYCPVEALAEWLRVAQITKGVVFKRIYKGGKLGENALTGRSVSLLVKKCAERAGYKEADISLFSGHSLRRGFITSAAIAGQSLVPIMNQTRHKKTDSVIGYISQVDLIKEHPGIDLLQP